jgi:hypothetical protein
LAWLLLLLAAGVLVWKADVVNSMATAVVLAVCIVPVGWGIRQLVGELALRRLYDRRLPVRGVRCGISSRAASDFRTRSALEPVPPLAVGRFVVDAEVQR